MDANINADGSRITAGRVAIYTLLVLVALYSLAPLYVMLTTSVKTLDQIRAGNLLDFPLHPTTAAWGQPWDRACTGVRCEGVHAYFWNSVRMVIPAVLLSSLIGSLNGYVLAHWRFRGSNVVFTALMGAASSRSRW